MYEPDRLETDVDVGEPPSSVEAYAECTECRVIINADARRCSSCGSVQPSRVISGAIAFAGAGLTVVLSPAAIGVIDESISGFELGLLVGIAAIGPIVALVGIGRYVQRRDALRAVQ